MSEDMIRLRSELRVLERWLSDEDHWLFFLEVLGSIPSNSRGSQLSIVGSAALFWNKGMNECRALIHIK